MAAPITDDDRDQVRRLHAAGQSRNQIARAIGRSSSTVSKIAREEGLRFEGGARVAPATEARQLDLAEQRRQIVARLYARASANLDRVEAEQYVRVELLPTGRPVRLISDEPPAQDERHHSQAIGSYLTSAARLVEIDAGTGAGEVRSMLTDLARGLRDAFADDEGDAGEG
ncbi:helix-turn-helix domain-containing protein [Streptomyces sp. VNUA116]|uniref:helix-turn-helix domain-containing protein n=1 Tax=Streptomyces sp. VNUA116 TaxID=3062449 RepID=UPI0026749051|nr:helix-turn-helix domain-containing protein [Streptomyces sp. VNUA116]WKU45982.1 helix-turn-helix domain-containing protein [Streptomyces sp. VNUA116]